jgi:hypothetical protein
VRRKWRQRAFRYRCCVVMMHASRTSRQSWEAAHARCGQSVDMLGTGGLGLEIALGCLGTAAGSHEPLVASTRRYFLSALSILRWQSGEVADVCALHLASRRVGEMLPSSHSCAVDFTNNCADAAPMCRVPDKAVATRDAPDGLPRDYCWR